MYSEKQVSELTILHYLESHWNINHGKIGFVYVFYILNQLCNNSELRNERRVMLLYQMTAEHFRTSVACVERGIRHWLQSIGVKETNGNFLFRCADMLVIHA